MIGRSAPTPTWRPSNAIRRGSAGRGPAADIFGLGVTSLPAAAGRRPFRRRPRTPLRRRSAGRSWSPSPTQRRSRAWPPSRSSPASPGTPEDRPGRPSRLGSTILRLSEAKALRPQARCADIPRGQTPGLGWPGGMDLGRWRRIRGGLRSRRGSADRLWQAHGRAPSRGRSRLRCAVEAPPADRRVSAWRKAILALALAYLTSPIDQLPDFLPSQAGCSRSSRSAPAAVLRGGGPGCSGYGRVRSGR